MTTKREFIQITPQNVGNGTFSDRNGLNQVIFELPNVPKICNGKSIRVSGTFKLVNGNGTTLPTNGADFFTGTAGLNDFYIDGRTGVQSCIETLSIQNLEGTVYSTIKSYNRLCSSLIPLNESIASYLNGGVDVLYGGLGKDVSTAKKCDAPFEFAIPILDGLFMGTEGGLDLSLLKGLRVVITLAPSNFVINNNKFRNPTSNGGLSDGGAFYELSNMKLSFEASVPPEEAQQAMMKNVNGVLEYNTYTNFYNVLQSTDHSISLNINTGRTIAVVGNFVPSEWVNNYSYGSSKTIQPLTLNAAGNLENRLVIDEYTWLRGGMRKPLQFEVKSEIQQTLGNANAEKNRIELNTLRDVWNVRNVVKSLKTELSNPLSDTEQAKFDRTKYSICEEDKVQQYNFGVNYDKISENGVSFKGQPLGLRIQSTLPAGQAMTPHSIYLYVKHKNTLVIQNGAIQVVS